MPISKAWVILALATGLTGCASSFGKVRETVAAAPDWYDDRAAEVRGEGYPRISRIPALDAGERSTDELEEGQQAVAAAEALFRMDPRAVPPGLELAEMMAWAEAARSEADIVASEPGGHLTAEDVAALRALFERSRAKS
ncbi:MAG: hypothetical protein MRY64_15470 [Hyphomonadaceae bacterium]|nr:hypothetical protein [Hyphomonadaceae bacterium]